MENDDTAMLQSPALAETMAAGRDSSPPKPRETIGRYQILRKVGAGGMGVVWEAIDPELDRRVAIKLMREALGSQGSFGDRLKREAQALAKLTHPNVVTVYDVGIEDNELYIVMQYVDGTTLDRAVANKSQRAILELFVQAARGLAAAHAAGIVHRDFKPTNVLVDRDGNVRVSDFGLARATPGEPPAGTGNALDSSVAAGELVGTPAYMAPEQFEGGEISPATDQFALCIALWEALYGYRPFVGDDVDTLRKAVTGGRVRETAPDARVPRRIRRALDRGLQVAPAARFASIDELIAALSPRRRAWMAAVGTLAVAGAAAGMAALVLHRDPCTGVERPVDAVWNAARRAAVQTALAADAPPVLARLDDRATRWRAMRRDACEATHVRGDQSPDVLARRETCLDRSLRDLHAAIDLLAAGGDRELHARAIDIAHSGFDPEECGAASASVAAMSRGHDELYDLIAKTRAANLAGRYKDVLATAATIGPKIDAAGDPELAARWYDALALTSNQTGTLSETMDYYQKAAQNAASAGLEELAARDWAALAGLTAQNGDLDGGTRMLAVASGAAKHSGGALAQMHIDEAEASIAIDRGDFKGAIAAAQRALAVALQNPSRVDVSDFYGELADAQQAAGDYRGAIDSMTKSLAIATRDRGADHPATINAVHHLAVAYESAGDAAHAKPLWERAQSAYERMYGANSKAIMDLLVDRANTETPNGAISTPDALPAIERAVAIGDKILPDKDAQRGQLLEVLAGVQWASNKHDDALATYRRAVSFYDSVDDPMGLARVLYNYGDTLKELGRCDEAIPQFRRAATTAAKTGQSKRMAGAARGAIGTCLARVGKRGEAIPELQAAIAILDEAGDVLFAAQTRWELADAYIKTGERTKGLAIARDATDQLAGRPPPAEQLRAQIVDWIKNPK